MKRYAKENDCAVVRTKDPKEDVYFDDIPDYGEHEVIINDD